MTEENLKYSDEMQNGVINDDRHNPATYLLKVDRKIFPQLII